jgi:O-antigen/teichoic acid export membrane protein
MAMRLNVAYGLVSAVGILLLGRYIIWLLYGARFIHADVALVFLAPALFFVPIFSVYNNLLAGDGRAGVTACILAGTVCVVGAVTYLAAPAWGIRGAALAVLCGNVFTALAGTVACWSLYRMNPLRCLLLGRSDVARILQALRGGNTQASA